MRSPICLVPLLTSWHSLSEAAALILRDAVDPSVLGHAVIVLVFALALSYFLVPNSMGSRRLWFASGVTIATHLADVIIMLVHNGRSIKDHPANPVPVEPTSVISSVNWEGFGAFFFLFQSLSAI